MSGIEVVGLVLGVLPLFIEGAKAYSHGVQTMQKAVFRRERDESLLEFYEEFYWEIVQLERQTNGIIESLPNLSDERKAELIMDLHLMSWTAEKDVAVSQALCDYFGSNDDLNAFMLVMGKIAHLLSQLIRDPTVHILSTDAEQSKIFNKLEGFAAERGRGDTISTFKERVRFWKKEKERTICLRNLATWNKRLFRLTEQAQKAPMSKKSSSETKDVPSSQLHQLSKKLYRALEKCWGCSCSPQHEAKFCLKARGDNAAKPTNNTAEIDFDFLFSVGEDPTIGKWQEGTVMIKSDCGSEKDQRSLLRRICDTVGCRGPIDQCLQFLVEDLGEEQNIWQLRSTPRRLLKHGFSKAESLQSVLASPINLPLVTKRRLSVIFAHSILQLHENYWRNKEWNKNQIYFFYDASGNLDFQHPYLSTMFNSNAIGSSTSIDLTRFHRNPSILALGILLIELHTGKLIETFRNEIERRDVNGNTDWLVANRVVKSMEDCSLGYKDAIQACLDTTWVPAGKLVDLEDVGTRVGVYQDVIKPLEDELVYMFREKI